MVEELRRLGAPEQPGELDLPAGGGQEIVAAHDERDALSVVVDRRRELIRPVAVAVPREQIAALLGRALLLQPVPQIDEPLHGRLEPDADADARRLGQPAIATGARIPEVRLAAPDPGLILILDPILDLILDLILDP